MCSALFLCAIEPTEVRNLRSTSRILSVTLSWDVPNQLNGILLHYTIRYSINGTSQMPQTTSDTNFTISSLMADTSVSNISVIATTGGGDGPPTTTGDTQTLSRPGDKFKYIVVVYEFQFSLVLN